MVLINLMLRLTSHPTGSIGISRSSLTTATSALHDAELHKHGMVVVKDSNFTSKWRLSCRCSVPPQWRRKAKVVISSDEWRCQNGQKLTMIGAAVSLIPLSLTALQGDQGWRRAKNRNKADGLGEAALVLFGFAIPLSPAFGI